MARGDRVERLAAYHASSCRGMPWPVAPGDDRLMPDSRDQADPAVHPLLRPLVWLAAVVWLPMPWAGRLFARILTGYSRGADAVGRAVMSGLRVIGRAAVRLFRPLRRVFALVARLWDWISLQFLTFLLRPVGRWMHAAFERVEPAAKRFVRAADRLARRVWRALAPFAAAIGDAARRLAGPPTRVIRRAWLAVRRSARTFAAAVAKVFARSGEEG